MNTLTTRVFNARLEQANVITKAGFDSELSRLNRKITSNKSKHLLIKNELKKLTTFDSSYFIGKHHFKDDIHSYLVFQSMYRYFKRISGVGNCIYFSKSKGLSDERTNSITTSNYSVTPNLSHYGTKTRVEFNGSCLKQESVTFNYKKEANIYTAYEIEKLFI